MCKSQTFNVERSIMIDTGIREVLQETANNLDMIVDACHETISFFCTDYSV